MDIAEILKNVPVGTKLYSPLCGEVVFEGVVDHKDGKGQSVSEIKVRKNNMFFAFNSDGDFRQMAIKLIGERGVVLQTIEMGLPLWEEDIEHIKRNLSNDIQKRIR